MPNLRLRPRAFRAREWPTQQMNAELDVQLVQVPVLVPRLLLCVALLQTVPILKRHSSSSLGQDLGQSKETSLGLSKQAVLLRATRKSRRPVSPYEPRLQLPTRLARTVLSLLIQDLTRLRSRHRRDKDLMMVIALAMSASPLAQALLPWPEQALMQLAKTGLKTICLLPQR